MISIACVFVLLVCCLHAIKYSSIVSIVSVRVESTILSLCVPKKAEGEERCVSWNGACGGEYER